VVKICNQIKVDLFFNLVYYNGMNPVIKKIKKFLKVTTASLLIAGTISAGAVAAVNHKFSTYATDEQIETIAEALDCDISYLTQKDNHYCVMGHNGDEPIYVYFDETLSEKDKAYAIESLDYVFGIVGDINSRYRYQIVDEAEYLKQSGKSTIKYTIGDPEAYYEGKTIDVAGNAKSKLNVLTKLTNKRVANRFYINIRSCDEATPHETILGIYIHELMHLIAFSDVHTLKSIRTTDKHYGNTIMQASHGGKMLCVLTPNDYKILISAFTENMSENELKESIGDVKQKVANYEKEYYKIFTKETIQRSNATHKLEKGDFSFTTSRKWVISDKIEYQNFYELNIVNNRYSLKIFDKNYKLVDEAVGKVIWCNGVAVLKDVTLKVGMHPAKEDERYKGGYIEDLSVISYGHKMALYNVFINDGYDLTPMEMEQELGLNN